MRQTRPAPILRVDAQPRAQRVALDLAQHGIEMLIFLDRKRLETSLIKMAGPGRVVMGMPTLRERVQGSSRSRYSEPYLRRTYGLVKLEGRPRPPSCADA